ncbi:MAG TPA: hypothetical protein VEC39_00830 [Vicinamibacterales bacterium]|nr:hypothetical protein [Vicinamibacterales bacterium]
MTGLDSPAPIQRYGYEAFGLAFRSDFPIAGLRESQAAPQVIIQAGPVDVALGKSSEIASEAGFGYYKLSVPDVARYAAIDGRQIIVQVEPGARLNQVRQLMFGSVFSALLHQRGRLVLHGGGVAGENGAVIIAGHSGRGKSTVLAALVRRNRMLMCDDVATVEVDDEHGPLLHAGPSQIMLAADSVTRFELAPSADLEQIFDKYAYRPRVAASPQRVKHIVILEYGRELTASSRLLSPAEAFVVIRTFTRNRGIVERLQLRERNVRLAAAVANTVPVTVIQRPPEVDSVAAVVDIVDAIVRASTA